MEADSSLLAMVGEVLQIPVVELAPDVSLAALGLDSLRAVELCARISDEMGVEVPLHTLLGGASIAELTELVPDQRPAVLVDRPRPDVDPAGPGLTLNQRSMLFLDDLHAQGGTANVLGHAVNVDGPLDVTALRATLDLLAARHPSLRVRAMGDGAGPSSPFADLAVVDASGWRPELVDRELERLAARPLDINAGPLWRFQLVRFDDDHHVLLVQVHHLAVDLWSLDILLREFRAGYVALTAGDQPPDWSGANSLAAQVRLEERMLDSPRAERLWQFWRECLADAPPRLELPTDLPRPERRSNQAGWLTAALPPDVSTRLAAIAAEHGLTLPSLLLAAFGWLLHRHCGQSDVVIGDLFANRAGRDRQLVVGYLANPLPVRLRRRDGESFLEYARLAHQAACRAMEHAEMPFPLIVERLRPERDASRTPVFQTMFVFQRAGRDTAAATLVLGGPDNTVPVGPLALRPRPLANVTIPVDLALEAAEFDNDVRVRLSYGTALFRRRTAGWLLRRWLTIVDRVSTDPTCRFEAGTGLDVTDRALLAGWNGPHLPFAEDELLHDPFQQWASRRPEALAVVDGARSVTYRELDQWSDRLAQRLHQLRLGPGSLIGLESRIGVCMPRSIECVAASLAVLKAGMAYVPLDPDLPVERLARMVERSQIDVVLVAEPAGRRALDALRTLRPAVLELPASVDSVSDVDTSPALPRANRRSLAYVMHTSGSTGEPKAIGVQHSAVANMLADFDRRGDLGGGARCGWWTGYSFDLSVYEIFAAFREGGSLVIVPEEVRYDGAALAGWAGDGAVESLYVPPFAVLDFCQAVERQTLDGLRRLMVGVEPIPGPVAARLSRALPRTAIVNAYGPTEVTVISVALPVDVEQLDAGRLPIGRALQNVDAYVLDAHGNEVPPGVVGELHLGGPQVARGYLGRPGLTARSFVPDRFGDVPGTRLYRSGDLVRYRGDGQIEFIGRADHQIKLHGQRVELGEIEAVLAQHPSVREAVAVVAAGIRPRILAYAIPELGGTGGPALTEDVLASAKRLLPRHMRPGSLRWVQAWPLSRNGKVDRSALAADQGSAPDRSSERATTKLERVIAARLAETLKLDDIGLHDNFFTLGGHSLGAAQVAQHLGDELGVQLPVAAIFQCPTVAELAVYVEGAARPLGAGAIPSQPRGAASFDTLRTVLDADTVRELVSKMEGHR